MQYPVRTCAHCKEPTLQPVSRELSGFNTVVQYQCSNCQSALSLTPAGSIGAVTTVGVLGLIFWAVILLRGDGSPDSLAWTVYGAAVAALLWITAIPAFVSLKNPPVQSGEQADVAFEPPSDFVQKIVILVERVGFLAGLLMPIVVVGVVLSFAALIGFINFTYFGN